MKRRSEYKAHFKADTRQVWDAMTNNAGPGETVTTMSQEDYERGNKAGIDAYFAITESIACRRYAFTLKNGYLTGNYSVDMSAAPDGGTDVTFIDEVEPDGLLLYVLSLLSFRMKKNQKARVSGLKDRLGESDTPEVTAD